MDEDFKLWFIDHFHGSVVPLEDNLMAQSYSECWNAALNTKERATEAGTKAGQPQHTNDTIALFKYMASCIARDGFVKIECSTGWAHLIAGIAQRHHL